MNHLPGDPEGKLAGGQQANPLASGEHRGGELRAGPHQVLAVVDDDQHRLFLQRADHGVVQREIVRNVTQAKRTGHRARDQRRVADRGQVDEGHPADQLHRDALRDRPATATRVLPIPPGPVIVTSGAAASAATIASAPRGRGPPAA